MGFPNYRTLKPAPDLQFSSVTPSNAPSTHRTGSEEKPKASESSSLRGEESHRLKRWGVESVGKEKPTLRQMGSSRAKNAEVPYGKRKREQQTHSSKMTIADLDNENFRPSYLPTRINPILPQKQKDQLIFVTKEDIHPMYFAGADTYRKKLQIQRSEKAKADNLVAQHGWKLKLKRT